MNNSNRNTSGISPPARPVKREPIRIPSPTHSCMTTATAIISRPGSGRPPSPAPSCSTTVLFGGRDRGQISIRPLSSMLDPDDQMSMVSNATATVSTKLTDPPPKTNHLADVDEVNDWRSNIRFVGDRLKYIFENDGKYQDVIFEVKGNTASQQFKAHKLILRIASPVFDRIFEEMDNSNQSSQKIIPVRDVEPSTFDRLLKFIYTDEVDTSDFDEQDVLPLLQAAKTYGVRQLYLECVKLFKTSMSDEVAVKLCEIAASYGDKLLQDAALDHIANKAFKIFPTDNFLRLSEENLLRLFARDDLGIDEVTLFESAIKWGEQRCIQQGIEKTPTNLRKVLVRLIPEIRFPLMRTDEMTLIVSPTEILSQAEELEFYKYLSLDKATKEKLPPISFKTTPRISQKSLECDSGSSSDYREASSASPEQRQILASESNTECVELTTTEAESETASTVSAYSGSRKVSRKFERSHSHSSTSSSKKRRKIEKEKSRRKSIEEKPGKSTQPIRLDDLFGDSDDKCIKVEDCTISLNNFILGWNRHDRRHQIESITLENVKIEDSSRLENHKVYFPRLKNFELNIKIEESINSIISEKRFEVQKYLFFASKHDQWSYDKLWRMGIDITLVINKVIVLRISHENSHVTLNKFSGAPLILKSLKEQTIRSLVYSHTHFTDKNFPLSLSRMVILGVVSSQCMSGFVKQFKHLKELTVVSPAAAADGSLRALTLDTEFCSKDKIRKLGLGSFKLHLEPTTRFYNIVTLSLWKVQWESYFEEKFHYTFPSIQELYLIGPGIKGSAKLLKNILRISSLTKIVSWSCDFRFAESDGGSEMKTFLVTCGLVDSEKTFVLKKKSDRGTPWVASKMRYTDLNSCIYQKYEYEYIYKDINTFTTTS